MNQPLLTIIVPCYNVEKYLDNCISSIVNQTYLNLDILLINDGSTDSTEMICDTWQKKDDRIRVIHKQNEGQAYGRKTGIENSTADFISFVDADDWIDANMYTEMMTALLSTGSDIAQCGVCMVYEEDGRKVHLDNEVKTGAFEIIERTKGVLLILENDRWHSWMWNKIFKRHLFDGIKFLKGNGYAEDFISLYLFHKANQSVFTSDEYYYYLQRNNSTTSSKYISNQLKNQFDFFEAWQERYPFVVQHPEYHIALPPVKLWVLRLGIHLLRNIIVYPQYFTVDVDKLFDTTAKQLRAIPLTRKDRLQRALKFEYYVLKFAGVKCYRFLRSRYVNIIHITNRMKITNRNPGILLSELWYCLLKDLHPIV